MAQARQGVPGQHDYPGLMREENLRAWLYNEGIVLGGPASFRTLLSVIHGREQKAYEAGIVAAMGGAE